MTIAAETVNFADPEVIARPQPVVDELQAQQPSHWNPSRGGWFATRFEDVRQVLGSPDFSVERFGPALKNATGDGKARLAVLVRLLGHFEIFHDPNWRDELMTRTVDALHLRWRPL